MNAIVAEFLGTFVLVLLGNGIVANVVLSGTKGHGAGLVAITIGWGAAVYCGASVANAASGAHLNPALSIALLVKGDQDLSTTIYYVAAQMLGAMMGALVVYLFYADHFQATKSGDEKLSCFSNSPTYRHPMRNFFCEMVGTFVLVFVILQFQPAEAETGKKFQLGAIGLLPVAILVLGIGLSLGGTTGYAINPARDLGPRIVHQLLPIEGKRDSDWGYAWIPVLGPIAGGVVAALLHSLVH